MASSIRVVYGDKPSFPATDQHPDAVRYGPYEIFDNTYWVDAIGDKPANDDVAKCINAASPFTQLKRYAAAKRYEAENGGVSVNGIAVPTNDRAKLLILGAASSLADDDATPFIANGVNYGATTGVQFRAINTAIIGHVQASFAVLADVMVGIDAGSITTPEQIDAAPWPKNL